MAAAAFLLSSAIQRKYSYVCWRETLPNCVAPKREFWSKKARRNLDFLLKDTRISLPLWFKPIRNQLLKWIFDLAV
jgi:hypothetical protein